MSTEPQMGFAETFLVWNDSINLVGAFIPANERTASICGTIRFENGKNIFFSSESNDSEVLHHKFMSCCESIATLYGTHLIHRKNPIAEYKKKSLGLFDVEHPMLN